MAQNDCQGMDVQMCDLDEELKRKTDILRTRRQMRNEAIIVKIDQAKCRVEIEEEIEECSVEDLVEELPERQPRYVVYSYIRKHDDGRQSNPYMFLYYCPEGCKPSQVMMYASSRNMVINRLGLTKSLEFRDREMLTESWLLSKLQK